MPIPPRASAAPLIGWILLVVGLGFAILWPDRRACNDVGEPALVGIVHDIQPMPDGGFVQVGFDHVRDADWELLVIRSNADGSFRWARRCGGSERDLARSVVVRPDGGMLVVGATRSLTSRVLFTDESPFNAWLLSFDADGRLLWERAYGGAMFASAQTVSRSRDGSYLVFGEQRSPEDPLKRQSWLLRVGPDGKLLWSRILGLGVRALPTPEGFALLANARGQRLLDLHISRGSPEAFWWLATISWAGEVDWFWTFRFRPRDFHEDIRSLSVSSIAPTRDSGYLLAGGLDYEGRSAAWIIKLNAEGREIWRRVLDAAMPPHGFVAFSLRDGGAYLVGQAHGKNRDEHVWAARLAADGEVVWQRTFVRGSPYAAMLAHGERLVIAGIPSGAEDRQHVLIVEHDGAASLVPPLDANPRSGHRTAP
jgi:hypothetical protein